MEDQVVQNVRVTNANDFVIEDRFDGVPYRFEPKKPLSIPLDAAFHIFGWFPGAKPEEVARHIQKRLGWNTPEMVHSSAHLRYYQNIKIEPIVYRLVEVEETDFEDEPPKATKPNKIMQAATESARRHSAG